MPYVIGIVLSAGVAVFAWLRYRERRGAGLVAGLVSRVRRRRRSRPRLAPATRAGRDWCLV